MTLAFLLFTAGTTLIYTTFKQMSVADLLKGNPPGAATGSDVSPGIASGDSVFTDSGGPSGGQIGTKAGSSVTSGASGTGTYQNTLICNFIIDILKRAVADGVPVHVCPGNGVRTIAQQRQACIDVCGNAGGCPGTCAAPGTSNHQGCTGGKGAIDICGGCTEFKTWLANHGNPIKNALPRDLCHFSRSGN